MYKHMQCLLTFAFAHVTPSGRPGGSSGETRTARLRKKRWAKSPLHSRTDLLTFCSAVQVEKRLAPVSVLRTAQRQLVHYRLPLAVQWCSRHGWAYSNQRLDFLCLLPSDESLRRHRYSAPSARTRTGSAPLHRLQRGQIEAYTVRCQPPCKRRPADWIRIHPARILYRCTGSAGRRYSVEKSRLVPSGMR